METQDKLVIEGTQVYDGEYEFDPSYFTLGEFKKIHQISGLTRGQIAEALETDHSSLWVAFAAIALDRNGASFVDLDVFWNTKGVQITFVEGTVDVGPPDGTPSGSTGPDGSNDTSGDSSDASSEPTPVTVLKPTGQGFSGLSASPPTTSAA